jgi:hypothetical protein
MEAVALDDLGEDGRLDHLGRDALRDVDVAHHVDGADFGRCRDPPVGVVGEDESAEAGAAEGADHSEGFFFAVVAFEERAAGDDLAGAIGDIDPVEDGGVHFRGVEVFVAAPVDVGVVLGRVPDSGLEGAVEGWLVVELIVVDDEELVQREFLL